MDGERFARRMFRWAAVYGVIVLAPMYLLTPPDAGALTHLGFVGLALVFQWLFWIIGGDPLKYRSLMPLSVAEKTVFAIPALVLVAHSRVNADIAIFAGIDLLLGLGFFVAWRRTA